MNILASAALLYLALVAMCGGINPEMMCISPTVGWNVSPLCPRLHQHSVLPLPQLHGE